MSDTASYVYPTAAVRQMIEAVAGDGGLTPKARATELRELRDELVSMAGDAERRIGDLELMDAGGAIVDDNTMMAARENADLRETLLARGLATADQLDGMGMLSHAQLDQALSTGDAETLQEGLGRAFGLGLLHGTTFNLRVRRGQGGKFSAQPGSGMVKKVLRDRRGNEFKVHPTRPVSAADLADFSRGATPDHPALHPSTKRQLEKRATGLADSRSVGTKEDVLRAGGKVDSSGQLRNAEGQAVTTREDIQSQAFHRRTAQVEQRTARRVAQGTRHDQHSEPHFNAADRISQRRLLEYVRDTATGPTTADQHGTRNPDGSITWDADRAALHHAIIDLLLSKRDENDKPHPALGKAPRQAEPTVVFTGGGYAAGKSSVVESGAVGLPPDHVKIDPDEIKALLPEFDHTLAGDPEANILAYEEAWDISQQLQRIAQANKMNVVVDGITNTSADEVGQRVESFKRAGYVNPRIAYVDVPTDVAVSRAMNRAKNAKKKSDRRYIPDQIIRAVHRDVAATIPQVLANADKLGVHVQVWNTDQGKAEDGSYKPPKLFMQAGHGHKGVQVLDKGLADAFQAKAQESVPGVHDAAATPLDSNPDSYFDTSAQTPHVPLERLQPITPPAANLAAINRLRSQMRAGHKRPPIQVVDRGDGHYEVINGDDVFGVAHAEGWTHLPVQVVDAEKAPDGRVRERLRQVASSLEGVPVEPPHQTDNNLESLMAKAAHYQELFRGVLDMGEGVSRRLNADTVMLDDPSIQGDPFEEAKKRIAADREKPWVVVGAVKTRESVDRKLEKRGPGYPPSKLTDLVRGTVLVPHADDLPRTIEALQQEAHVRGWKISALENRMVRGGMQGPGPISGGYRDVSLRLETADGFQIEMQLNTTEMWVAKEVEEGHRLYEEFRTLPDEPPPLSAALQVRKAQLESEMERVYAQAWDRSQRKAA